MIESYGNNQFTTINVETLFQASVNCLVRDGFIVKYTNNHGDSMNYLSRLTTLLRNVYSVWKKNIIFNFTLFSTLYFVISFLG